MSVLAYPRIHFQGEFSTNPATANNDDVMVNIDPAQATLSASLAAMSNAQAHSWLMEGYEAKNPLNGNLTWYLKSGWNYYGDMYTQFLNARVCALVGADGNSIASDPLLNQPIQITGCNGSLPVITDVDPRGGVATQIFLGGLTLGDSSMGLAATYDTRCYSRWITFRTCGSYSGEQAFVGFGANWQFAIPSSALSFASSATSTVLSNLQSAIPSCQGILVQFTTYQVQPTLTDEQLIKNFQNGQLTRNPAIGFLVGTIGLWENGELMTAPGGRRLQAATPSQGSLPFGFGPCAARVQPHRAVVSLNLITTFPEANYDRPPTQKMDLGQIQLGLIPPSQSKIVILGNVPYNYPNYATTGGIADITYDPKQVSPSDLANGTLVLVSDQFTGGPLLTEDGCEIVAETDNRGVYLERGQSVDLLIQVLEKEGPPTSDVTFTLFEYQNVLKPAGPQERTYSIITLVDPSTNPAVPHCLSYPTTVVFPKGQTTPISVKVTGIASGPATLVFTQNGQPLSNANGNPWSTASFANIRVMPEDNYDAIPISQKLTWPFVYKEIFRFHDLLFPAMSQYIPFDNEEAMKQSAQVLVDRTDPTQWNTTLYMPVTRDLSQGKRKLLVDWANSLKT